MPSTNGRPDDPKTRSDRRRFIELCAGGTIAALAGCTGPLSAPRNGGSSRELIDDWQYDPDEAGMENVQPTTSGGGESGGGDGDDGGGAVAQSDSESIGLAAGGAADVTTFRRNVKEGYLPIPDSLPYEGLFHDYYFDTGGDGSCSSTFCPTYTPAVSPDPFTEERRHYLTVGLDSGIAVSEFDRPALNLVIVLDISGSMGSGFREYYYDAYGNRQEVENPGDRSKMQVAKDALVAMTDHLRPDDRLGVVLFNSQSHLAKPLRRVDETDMEAIRGHIQEDIQPNGGTNVSAGIAQSEELLSEYAEEAGQDRENRTILLTDAQINTGVTDDGELRDTLAENAEAGHHSTFVGVGVDFNAELIDEITSIKGANYYSVHSPSEFEQRLDDEFEYMVTPLVYDLSLELDADGYDIASVYGSTAAEEATGELMSVRTLFPSPSSDGKAKGGVVLVELDRADGEGELSLTASWETRDGDQRSTTESVTMPDESETYGNDAIRKAIVLSRYATVLRNWTIYERTESTELAEGEIESTDRGLGRWELQSDPLTVSDRYETRLQRLREYMTAEIEAIGDDDLRRELDLIDTIFEMDEQR